MFREIYRYFITNSYYRTHYKNSYKKRFKDRFGMDIEIEKLNKDSTPLDVLDALILDLNESDS
jgi:hypothetical protein